MASRNSTFLALCCLFLILLTKPLLLEAIWSNSSSPENLKIDCIEMEREALLKFKQGLKEPSGLLSSWVGNNCCNWIGVGCSNKTGNVVRLDLKSLDYCDTVQENEAAPYKKSCLSGTLYPSLINLTYLYYLDISCNSFEGTPIPEFIGSLKNLRYLDLAQASFSGMVPPSLGNLSKLQYLNMHSNSANLWVSDLNWLSDLSSLQYLGLGGIDLGKVTSNWVQVINMLPSLLELKLSDCRLNNFPRSLPVVNFTSLSVLDISDNNFPGTPIPEFICSLKNLRYLDLSGTFFSGMVPPSLGNLSKLQYLDLTTYAYSEIRLWVSDLNWLSGLSSLQYLSLNGVNLSRSTTNWLKAVSMLPSLLELNLSRCELNDFPHSLPFVNLTSLSVLDLSLNDFQGALIPEIIGSLKNLSYLDLSDASYGGMVPPSLGNLSNLQYLDLTAFSYPSKPWVSDLKWLSGLSSLKLLRLQGMNLSRASNSWLQDVNMLPSLLELKLDGCELHNLPHSLPFVNFTSLSVLDLSVNNFSSPIPQYLFNISTLVTVALSSCELSGSIPKVPRGSLCNLRTLRLPFNHINGEINEFIEALSGCSNSSLETLELNSNEFRGHLPDSLENFKNLRFLTLFKNSIVGQLPTSIGNLSLLETLDLSFNKMTGTIAESIGQLVELFTLSLYWNSWEGIITENHLRNLTRLKFFTLSSTSTGKSSIFNVRHDWIAPFSLRTIVISDFQLGPAFPSWLRTQVDCYELVLSNVAISDGVPDWFWKLVPNFGWLDLSHNQLRGEFPKSPINVARGALINLGYNRLEGSIPVWSNFTFLSLRNNLLTGSIPLNIGDEMSALDSLDLSGNLLDDNIPASIREMRYLSFLDLSNNSLSGKIPSIWHGLKKLTLVDFSNNSLSGGIPTSICSLPALRWLKLSRNKLSGDISMSLQNCKSLAALDLGGNRFFGTIPVTKNLFFVSYLGLRANKLTGNIPEQLCRFPKLHILDLAHNNLSGSIPRCLGNLVAAKYIPMPLTFSPSTREYPFSYHLELVVKGRLDEYTKIIPLLNDIDLSSNNLVGEIPEEIANLSALGNLNLSRNKLTGKIPENIGSIRWLETLDLSCNNLSGPIPPGMSSLTSLHHLNLSYNNLSGPIPSTNQFQTFNDPSIYEGNPNLCGPPLKTDCSSGLGDAENKDREDIFETLGFYVSLGLGFIVGFWTVCGTLVIKKSWRHAYFRFVDDMKDKLLVIIAVNVAHLRRK